MTFKKLVSTLTLPLTLLFGAHSQAGIISHGGYTYDESSNVVVGFGQEWLRWDQTLGMSVSDVLADPAYSDWRIATNADIAHLANQFDFGDIQYQRWYREYYGLGTGPEHFDADPNTPQVGRTPYTLDSFDPQDLFLDLFGYLNNSSVVRRDISVFFGDDPAADGLVNIFSVATDYIYTRNNYTYRVGGIAYMGDAYPQLDTRFNNHGVALIKGSLSPVLDSATVPTPGSLALFGLGLVGLTFRARNTKT